MTRETDIEGVGGTLSGTEGPDLMGTRLDKFAGLNQTEAPPVPYRLGRPIRRCIPMHADWNSI